MDHQKAKTSIDTRFKETILPALEEYISIPNQSPDYDDEWATNGHMEKAMDVIVNWVKAQNVPGLQMELLTEAGRTPILVLDVPASEDYKGTKTVMLYGHMDKQPPLTEDWAEGLHPYKPVYRDGKLYGRGGADDGYSTFAAVTAIQLLIEQNLARPRCVVVIEACEESGSADLIYYMKKLTPRLGDVSLIVCLDSGCGNYEQFWLTTSLRGVAGGVLTVKILREGVHSGDASGVVPSSFRIIRQLLDRVEDSKTGEVLVKQLYRDIPQKRLDQAKGAAEALGDVIFGKFPFVKGATAVSTNPTELLLNKTWRPTVSYTGAKGFPTVEKAGNVLRAESHIKLSVRIPPGVDAKSGMAELKKVLEANPPYGAQVSFEMDEPMNGWESPILAPWLESSITDASNAFFGKPALNIGEGGSIPFMGMLGEQFPNAQFAITGILGPESNAHGPNEFLHIAQCKGVTGCVAAVLHDFTKAN